MWGLVIATRFDKAAPPACTCAHYARVEMAVDDDSALVERFVRAILEGNLRLPGVQQFSRLGPEIPELAQPLSEFYKAIETFVSKVNGNRAPGPRIELEPVDALTEPEPEPQVEVEPAEAVQPNLSDHVAATSTNSCQNETQPPPSAAIRTTGSSRDKLVDVASRMKDGVVTLLPNNKRECQDLPFLAAQACKRGADDAGVFKYILSTDCDTSVSSGQVPRASSFTSSLNTTGVFVVTYHPDNEPMTVTPTHPEETEPQILAARLEDIMKHHEQSKELRYCTDHPAQTEEQRRACGLPLRSPIHPLPHNRLDDTLYEIDGLHSPYGYFGTGLFTIHREDNETWSINVLYKGGPVLWLTIDPKDASILEGLESQWSCDQKLRHESWYFTVAELKRLGVSYRQFLQYPGEAVVVFGKTYHQGGNVAGKVAEAVNYAPPSWTVEGYKECKRGRRGCPDYPIPNAYLRFRQPGEAQRRQDDGNGSESQADSTRRKSRDQDTAAAMVAERSDRTVLKAPGKRKILPAHLPKTKKRRKSPDPNSALSARTQSLRTLDPRCVIPRYIDSVVSPSVLKLVTAILSMPAIVAFCDLVRARRHTETPTHYWTAEDGHEYQLEQRVRNLHRIQARSVQNKFDVRVHEFELARFLKHMRKGQIRSDTQVIKNAAKRSGWDYGKFKYHERCGKKWLKLFESYPGLLCFLLVDDHNPFEVTRADYLTMSASDVSMFQKMLVCDHTEHINAVGEKFIQSLSPSAEDVEFQFEAETVSWEKLPMPEALEHLRPIVGQVNNIYRPEKYPGWSRPPDWPEHWQWPTNPTSILDGSRCELCSLSQCDCIITGLGRVNEMQPRIKDYAGKGRGIRAVARTSGQVAYAKGACVGVLSGEIIPAGVCHGNMVMEFNHPDILYEPVVCQIDFAQSGSYLRLVNHSCRPSASVKVMRVSGQYRLVMIAARDIYDAEEITVDYKRASLDRPCLCGTQKCRERARATMVQ